MLPGLPVLHDALSTLHSPQEQHGPHQPPTGHERCTAEEGLQSRTWCSLTWRRAHGHSTFCPA